MRTLVSSHSIQQDSGMKSRALGMFTGLLLASAGTVIKFVPAVGAFIQQYLSGIYGFMMEVGWALLLCMAVGAFVGMRSRKGFYSAVKVYEEGIGLLTSSGNEVFADYGKCRLYLSRSNLHETIRIKSDLFPKNASFNTNDLKDYQLFTENVQRYGTLERV